MASAVVLLFLAVVLAVQVGELSGTLLIRVECLPAVGVVGLPTKISCSFKTSFESDQNIIISALSVTKRGEEDPVFTLNSVAAKKDSQFGLPSVSDPSLLITSTAVSDEGWYDYVIITNRGVIQDGTFRVIVRAKYSKPSMSSSTEHVEDGGPADLYCNATGGYPAGAIHWFDSTGTNWTKSATLETTDRADKLVYMSSKLTFASIDSNWAPFRCVVLNSQYVKEEENTLQPSIKDGISDKVSDEPSKLSDAKFTVKIVAPVVVIGSLIVGLLLVLLLRGRCHHRGFDGDGLESVKSGGGEEDQSKAKGVQEVLMKKSCDQV